MAQSSPRTILHIEGKPYILLPLHEYRALAGRVQDGSLPLDIQNALTAGTDHPVKTIRIFRGFTQQELATQAGLSRPYLTEIETGRKEGSLRALKALARALQVDLDVLIPD